MTKKKPVTMAEAAKVVPFRPAKKKPYQSVFAMPYAKPKSLKK